MKNAPGERPILLIGTSETCPDIEYASGFQAVDAVVFLEHGKKKHLVVPQMELGRAQRAARGADVLSPEQLALSGGGRWRLAEAAAALLRRERIRTVVVPRDFPYGTAVRLQKKGIRLRIAEEELFPQRAVKRPDEIRKIREAQQAAVIAMRSAVEMISESEEGGDGCLLLRGRRLEAEDVRRMISRVLLEHDCISRDIIVAGGMQAVDPHEKGTGFLRAHEAIVIDIFPRHQGHGYWGDLTRTVIKGTVPASLRTMYHAVRAAQAAALSRIRAGRRADSVHRAVIEEFEKRGFHTETKEGKGSGFIHGTGHGVGLAIHEAPVLGLGKTFLRAGNVVTVEPGLYYPGIGGIRIEDTVVVTPTGWRYLVPCEKRFEV